MQITDKTFLVTGGASGLGAATVEALAQAGGRVVIADIRRDPAEWLLDEFPDQVQFAHVDVTNAETIQKAVDLAVNNGGLFGAINCAGIATAEKTLSKDGPHRLDTFTRTIHVNLIGSFSVARLAAAAMAQNPGAADTTRGVIINTASIAAEDGQAGQTAYAASKAGIVGMTLPMARDLARHSIRVVTILPGVFQTRMLAGLPDTVAENLRQQIPFPPRFGKPEEFGALATHIIENDMLNGETIRLDGALRMT